MLYRVPPSEILAWGRADLEFMRAYFSLYPEPDGYLEAAIVSHTMASVFGAKTKLTDHIYRYVSEEEMEANLCNFFGG